MSILYLNSDNFDETVNKKGLTAVVDFYADWCGPCKMFGPVFEETANEMSDENLIFAKVNVDEAEDIADRYEVMSIPTVVVIKDGKVTDRNVGLASKNKLLSMVK